MERVNNLIETNYLQFNEESKEEIQAVILEFLRREKGNHRFQQTSSRDEHVAVTIIFELVSLHEKSLVDALLSNLSNSPNLISSLGQIEYSIQSILNSGELRGI